MCDSLLEGLWWTGRWLVEEMVEVARSGIMDEGGRWEGEVGGSGDMKR